MTCPFYGMTDRGLGVGVVGVLRPSYGNQCALVRIRHSPCWMEKEGLPVGWEKCLYGFGALPADQNNPDCIAQCVACGRPSHICRSPRYCDAVAKGLCPVCLDRAERLAAEAAGQQRLIP